MQLLGMLSFLLPLLWGLILFFLLWFFLPCLLECFDALLLLWVLLLELVGLGDF